VSQEFIVNSPEELGPVAEAIHKSFESSAIILLKGEMGTGKTTLVKSILKNFGHHAVSSPTFSLVNQYDTSLGEIYHFDLYRIEEEEELLDIGIEEYLDSGQPCLIEWPEKVMSFIDRAYRTVSIALQDDGSRQIKISAPLIP